MRLRSPLPDRSDVVPGDHVAANVSPLLRTGNRKRFSRPRSRRGRRRSLDTAARAVRLPLHAACGARLRRCGGGLPSRVAPRCAASVGGDSPSAPGPISGARALSGRALPPTPIGRGTPPTGGAAREVVHVPRCTRNDVRRRRTCRAERALRPAPALGRRRRAGRPDRVPRGARARGARHRGRRVAACFVRVPRGRVGGARRARRARAVVRRQRQGPAA